MSIVNSASHNNAIIHRGIQYWIWPGVAYTISFCVCLDITHGPANFKSNGDTNPIEIQIQLKYKTLI